MRQLPEIIRDDGKGITVDRNMALRFMGMRRESGDGEFNCVYEGLEKEYLEAVRFCAVVKRSRVVLHGDGVLELDFGTVKSYDLEKNLKNATEAYIFCACSCPETDRAIRKKSLSSPFETMVLDSIASAGIEAFCDKINKEMGSTLPRYSPGYGDLSLQVQEKLLSYLRAERIGVSLCENLMMLPRKTVTAIVGIREE